MKVIPQVTNALIGEVPVVVPPRKLFIYIATGLEALQLKGGLLLYPLRNSDIQTM